MPRGHSRSPKTQSDQDHKQSGKCERSMRKQSMKRIDRCAGIQNVLRAGLPAALFLVVIAAGCNGKSDSRGRAAIDQASGTTAVRNGATAQANADPGINLNCVIDRIQNPPE